MASERDPSGDLVLSGGTLYGVCSYGGKIFAINPDGSGYRSVFVFSGFTVLQSVMISGTKLYGTTFAPGSVFSVNLDGTGFQSLYSFTDGPSQWGGLALFGTTLFGTTWNPDTQNASIFRIGIDGSDFGAIEDITNSLIGADLLLSDRTLYGAVDAVGGTNAGFLFSLSLPAPTILASPLTQTVEVAFPVTFGIRATGVPPLSYQWFFNGTNALANATNQAQSLTNIQPSQAGYYSVTVTNVGGSSTGSPAALSVIPYVPRKLVPFVTVSGDTGSSLSLGFWDSVGGSPNWNPLASFVLTNNSQSYPDLSDPPANQHAFTACSACPNLAKTFPSWLHNFTTRRWAQ